jgi:RNA polymerase sigma-70 factor (ECF subfamily)
MEDLASGLALRGERAEVWSDADLRVHEAALRAAARYICSDDGERDDLIQDTLERALRHLRRGQRPTHMRAWLVTILRNAFIDRKRVAVPAFQPLAEVAAAQPEPPPPWQDVSLGEVQRAVGALEPELRVPFELHYFEQRRYREIAAQLGLPVPTVATRLFRARKQLRAALLARRAR